MLENEKKATKITALETNHSSTTYDKEAFMEYLEKKREVNKSAAGAFYARECWRNWRLRMHASSKSSSDHFLNKVATTYGPECRIFYGNWSRKDQMNPQWG